MRTFRAYLLSTVSKKLDPSEPRLAGELTTHLQNALAANEELQQTKIGPFIPESDFERTEAEAHAFLGLAEGMRGNGAESLRDLVFAAEAARSTGFREGEIRSLLFLGELGLRGVNRNEGLLAAQTLRERADRYEAASYRIWARLLLARYAREQGRSEDAIVILREADAILSVQRSKPEVELFAEVCRLQHRIVYEFLVEMLVAVGPLRRSPDGGGEGQGAHDDGSFVRPGYRCDTRRVGTAQEGD